MKKKFLVVFLLSLPLLALGVVAEKPEKRFVDFDFRIKDHNLNSPELLVSGYLTPNRNLVYSHVDINIFGAMTTLSPLSIPEKSIYNDLYIGETVEFNIPILVTSTEHNHINITVRSVDKKKNRKTDIFDYYITKPMNSIVSIKKSE